MRDSNGRPVSTASPGRRAALAAVLSFTLAAAAQCGTYSDPSSHAFKSCPSGSVRGYHPNVGGLSKPYACVKL